ncbi:MAG: chromosome segregation protein SMC [Candidatus Bathyarchaeota archaeon]|nr:MAG: chromosome segregation protein SMC [Candidatus Bathyarchaeota archaeon]
MVHISRVNVRNFKSFNGSVKLDFDQGFNVITGPNGSGKSNIIDAVQFVFGELGSKRMRVPDLAGLIYDGAGEDGSKPQFSQVTVYFNNSDRGLAIDRKSVSVGRRIDKQGKSKYFLNGKRTSRRRLLDLLVMAGISPGGYNIVLQGTATRLSDLMPSERMTALEDLIGITEYDEKKSEAKVRLAEAERKIEVASAKGDEVRKRVNELERQRNDAIRHELLTRAEQRLTAFKLTYQITQVEFQLKETRNQIEQNLAEVAKIETEKINLLQEREKARERLEEFSKEASVKGNTRLPMLKSDLVGKRTLKNSLEQRIRELDNRKTAIQGNIEVKLAEIESSEVEKEEKRQSLQELISSEKGLTREIRRKETQLQRLSEKIRTLKETAEANQVRVEELTENLVPMQESLSGLEIEINRHLVNINSLESKLEELERKRTESGNTVKTLEDKIEEYERLKLDEAQKLEDMLSTIEEQVQHQKNLRGTIEGANKLAKDAEVTITEFTAKRDLWKNIVTEEKALERIREMGEAGALKGYHGPLRNLLKIDLKYQRATSTAAENWINAVVVEDIRTAIDCVEGLKKTKLGMTRFLPLRDINPPEPLVDISEPGVVGYIPRLIRYEKQYTPAVHLIWGDTFIVEDHESAIRLSKRGYRTVTLSGDLFEADGGLIGGHWRRPPDYSKLIPSEESIKDLSATIRTLRARLMGRMSDLKKAGGSLREFTGYMDHFNKNIEGIDGQIRETQENIERLGRTEATIDENSMKINEEQDRQHSLVNTLNERKDRTLQEIERTKSEIAKLKELSPSDVASLEVTHDNMVNELADMRNSKVQLVSDIQIQTNIIAQILDMKTSDSEGQIEAWKREIETFEQERVETLARLDEETREMDELQKSLNSVTSEVEATSRILERHRATVRRFDRQIERQENRRSNIERRNMSLSVEVEKYRLQAEQRFDELARLGFEDIVSIEDVELGQVERTLQKIRLEKSSLGMINQLAIRHYEQDAYNYKQLSVRINELEEERGSILKFIDEVEQEKTAHFMNAYNQICENFSGFFEKLTGGGDGRLELQKPESPFSGGVDLYVQFPGKPMRLASGASGGERSVAAIAYLLAIQRFLKAPFYLFDEIDAHLDDLNTARLADVLKENALESQFLMVSLKDVMVHNADKIYGVFAQGGRSKVISLPMKVEVSV